MIKTATSKTSSAITDCILVKTLMIRYSYQNTEAQTAINDVRRRNKASINKRVHTHTTSLTFMGLCFYRLVSI